VNKLKIVILLLPLLFQSIIKISAQNNQTDTTYILSGKIIDPGTKEGISYASIKIEDSFMGRICDSLGFFHLRVYPQQNLIISALGFHDKVYTCNKEISEIEVFVEIPLDRTSYMIKEVSVYHPGTWAQFRTEFLNCKIPKDSNQTILKLNLPYRRNLDNGVSLKMGSGMMSVGFGFNNNAKKRKARKKVMEMTISEFKQEILSENYNKNTVSTITKETGKRLDALMVYINDRQTFTYQTSSYYIGCKILQLHKEFMVKFPPLHNFKNLTFTDSIGISRSLLPDSLR